MKKQNKKHQNVKSVGEKLKTKGLMLFISFVSCDLELVGRSYGKKLRALDLIIWQVRVNKMC